MQLHKDFKCIPFRSGLEAAIFTSNLKKAGGFRLLHLISGTSGYATATMLLLKHNYSF